MNRRIVFHRLLHLFPKGKLVDLGTGHGGFAKIAADLGWAVTAVDARSERWPSDERIEWVKSDVRDFDLSGYDLISCLGLFYHLTCKDQIKLLKQSSGIPMIIDTHLDHGTHTHKLSDRFISDEGYEGRLRIEPQKTTSSWKNETSFWPTLSSFHKMALSSGYSISLTVEPWHAPDRTFFILVPELK